MGLSHDEHNMMKKLNIHGQIVVEYILLLIVAVTIALLITNTMVSRSPNNTGFLILKWRQIIDLIGQDTADDPIVPQN